MFLDEFILYRKEKITQQLFPRVVRNYVLQFNILIRMVLLITRSLYVVTTDCRTISKVSFNALRTKNMQIELFLIRSLV